MTETLSYAIPCPVATVWPYVAEGVVAVYPQAVVSEIARLHRVSFVASPFTGVARLFPDEFGLTRLDVSVSFLQIQGPLDAAVFAHRKVALAASVYQGIASLLQFYGHVKLPAPPPQD